MVLGNFAGIFIIAFLLLPLYYRLRLTSIYSYLGHRFGPSSEKSGAVLFILSRLMGSALRMYIVVYTIYEFSFRQTGLPFWVLSAAILLLILLYTFKGGIKSVIWTDMLQTTCLLLAVAGALWILKNGMELFFQRSLMQYLQPSRFPQVHFLPCSFSWGFSVSE